MKSYAEWCKHYNYDPSELRSKNEYKWYVENLDLFTRISSGDVDRKFYWIKGEGDKGWWKPSARGYTDNIELAGIFEAVDLMELNLNGCTLYCVRDARTLRSR